MSRRIKILRSVGLASIVSSLFLISANINIANAEDRPLSQQEREAQLWCYMNPGDTHPVYNCEDDSESGSSHLDGYWTLSLNNGSWFDYNTSLGSQSSCSAYIHVDRNRNQVPISFPVMIEQRGENIELELSNQYSGPHSIISSDTMVVAFGSGTRALILPTAHTRRVI